MSKEKEDRGEGIESFDIHPVRSLRCKDGFLFEVNCSSID